MSTELRVPPPEQLHASAIQYLIDGGDQKAAGVLLSCQTSIAYVRGSSAIQADITLRAPRPVYLFLKSAIDYRDMRSYMNSDLVGCIGMLSSGSTVRVLARRVTDAQSCPANP
jgi:hypothetical protein